MYRESIHISGSYTSIRHEMRSDSGRKIEWNRPNGTVRIPEEKSRNFRRCEDFIAAGKRYSSWDDLCVSYDETRHICRDLYEREVFFVCKGFPCFDIFDSMYENRCYRWFFIKENGRLTRVYLADGGEWIQVTEDVRNLEDLCLEQMEEMGWLK